MKQRITIAEVIENDWFKKGYQPPVFQQEDVNLDDVNAIFDESAVSISQFLLNASIQVFEDFSIELKQ